LKPANMPPSTSSSKKDKGKKSQKPKPKPIDAEEEKKLAEEFLATSFGKDLGLTDEKFAAAGGGRAPTCPDNPPCDGCSQPFAGTMQCSGCESVFYCGRECQVSHWKAQHKAECAEMKQQNEETAREVLESFKEFRGWEDLDVAGAYKAAVHQGLHDKIREVLELDKTSIVERFNRDKVFVCYTNCVMSVLFRGQRAEGKMLTFKPAFNCVDGLRIKGYVRSHPDALDAWLQASVELLRVFTDRATLRNPHTQQAVHKAARDVWTAWSLVFASSVASRAILADLPAAAASSSGEEAESAEQRRKRSDDHALRIVTIIGDAVRLIGGANPRQDPSSVVEANVYTVAAMVHLRLLEYRSGVNAEAVLNPKGMKKQMFQHVAIPYAKRMIEKGTTLNAQESNAVMAVASRGLGIH
jgi:MYND finger